MGQKQKPTHHHAVLRSPGVVAVYLLLRDKKWCLDTSTDVGFTTTARQCTRAVKMGGTLQKNKELAKTFEGVRHTEWFSRSQMYDWERLRLSIEYKRQIHTSLQCESSPPEFGRPADGKTTTVRL